MRIKVNNDAGTLRIIRGGGFGLTMWGLIFAGVPMVFVYGIVMGHVSVPGGNNMLVLAAMGATALVGVIVALGRRGMMMTKSDGRIESWWGLLIPFSRSQKGKFSDYARIALRKDVRTRRSKNGTTTYTVFPVSIAGVNDFGLAIGEVGAALEGRRVAESLANFCNLPLHDSTSGSNVVREPGYLDESIAQRHRRLSKKGEAEDLRVAAPQSPRCRIDERAKRVSVSIPARGIGGLWLLLMLSVVPGAVAAYFMWDLLSTNLPGYMSYVAVGVFCGLPFLLVLVGMVLPALIPSKIVVGRDRLKVGRLFGGATFPLAEVEELEVIGEPGKRGFFSSASSTMCGLYMASDDDSVCVGGHIDREELRWVRARVMAAAVQFESIDE